MGKAQRYRERAEGLRKIAGEMPESNTQRMLLGIAREYERLAVLHKTESDDDPAIALAALKKPDGDSN